MDELMPRQSAQRRLTMLMLGSFGVLGDCRSWNPWFDGLRRRAAHSRDWRSMALGATRSRVMAMVMSKAFTLISAVKSLAMAPFSRTNLFADGPRQLGAAQA
jgi:hypothetical protein